jgi:hypothetical protein
VATRRHLVEILTPLGPGLTVEAAIAPDPAGYTCAAMKTPLLLVVPLVCLPTLARAASPAAGLRASIAAKDWPKGLAACAALPDTETRRGGFSPPPASHYAELATLCAALASGAGDQASAEWWWFTAAAMDLAAAQRLLPELRDQGLLQQLPPPRQPAGAAVDPKPASPPQVTLPDGATVAGDPVQVTERPRPPKWMHFAARSGRPTEVAIEMLVGEDGVARQPVLVSAKALPTHTFLAFAYFRQWRFAPARVDGKPVAAAFALTLSAYRVPG